MPDFYTILTNVGANALIAAQAGGTTVNLTELAVGDGLAGAAYDPVETQTALENEVWRGGINQIYVDGSNPNWLVIEAIVPQIIGGWFVREVGIFDDGGAMIAIGKYPETYKPALGEGSAKDLYIRFILEMSNTANVTLLIDPAIVLASRKYVDDAFLQHLLDLGAHLAIVAHDLGFEAGMDGDGLAIDLVQQRYGRTVIAHDMTVTGEFIDLEGAPTGGAAEFDILVNGVSIYTALPSVAALATVGTAGTLDGTKVDLTAGDVVEFFCTQVGLTEPGKLASATLKGHLR